MLILPQSFYARDTLVVAKELLGKILVRKIGRATLSGRIVETEAYVGSIDPACHAFKGQTKRNQVMFGPPGHAYVYFTYGKHFCLNFVTEPEGNACAVLIRALEPIKGIKHMIANRRIDEIKNICSGPAKLTQAFSIGREENGFPLFDGNLLVYDDSMDNFQIGTSGRIGINAGTDLPWRYFIKNNQFVSRLVK